MNMENINLIDVTEEALNIDGQYSGIWNFKDKIDLSKDVIIGMSPTNYHCYLICQDIEYHPRFSFNKARLVRPRRNAIRAGFFIRIEGLVDHELLALNTFLKVINDGRTRSCHLGVLEALFTGIGLSINTNIHSNLMPKEFFESIMKNGLKINGRQLKLSYYSTKGSQLSNIFNEVSFFQKKFRWAYKLSDAYYYFLTIFNPTLKIGGGL